MEKLGTLRGLPGAIALLESEKLRSLNQTNRRDEARVVQPLSGSHGFSSEIVGER